MACVQKRKHKIDEKSLEIYQYIDRSSSARDFTRAHHGGKAIALGLQPWTTWLMTDVMITTIKILRVTVFETRHVSIVTLLWTWCNIKLSSKFTSLQFLSATAAALFQ